MKPHPISAAEPAGPAAVAPDPGDEACKRAIADALWTEIHWLFPRDRRVTVTVDGDDIAVALGPCCTARRPLIGGLPMMLLTKKHRERLLRNGRNRDQDHAPVVKFFNPCGAATWLFNELDPEDGDTLFGLADLGFGTPELGYSSLAEIAAIRLRWGLAIERDRHFQAKHPMSVYTQAARAAGHIVEHGPELDAAAGLRTSAAA